MRPVDFFVVGAQKAGSTAIDRMLRDVPGLQMSRRKEVHFFDREEVDWAKPPYDEFHSFFDAAGDDVLRGETTPIYMYWPDSLRRIRDYNPQARLIAILRHPVYRAYSQWKMQVSLGEETLGFEEAVTAAGRRRVGESEAKGRRFSYVERGFYHPQIQKMFALFPRDQVLVTTSDRLRADPNGTIVEICDLLGVDRHAGKAGEHGYVVAVDTRQLPDIPPDQVPAYLDLFRDDIIATSALTGLELEHWLSPDYREHPV